MNNKNYYNGERSDKYFKEAKKANEKFIENNTFKIILSFFKKGFKICDFGCGEGSKTISFTKKGFDLYGIDISGVGIERAKEKNKDINFSVQNIEKTSFKNDTFDVTMTFYVLEHIINPEKVIDEMYRVTKKGGIIILELPNYGSPFFPSPPTLYKKNFFQKIFLIVKRLFKNNSNSFYTNVNPILDKWEGDYDTRSEIYLKGLLKFLQKEYKIEILYYNSFWEYVKSNIYILFKMMRFISPIKYMGDKCFIIMRKNG